VEDMGMTDGADYRTCHPGCLLTLDMDVQEFH
jgi:hypothetical protein